ncbi:hypothetical protein QQF64_003141 [Cirrhinus molitorella]|uniref:Uncharacterized protein n=1 Tax=Cirrhinus molitorella TaxID=172907 RepID=A0ABR3MJ63_9TELE
MEGFCAAEGRRWRPIEAVVNDTESLDQAPFQPHHHECAMQFSALKLVSEREYDPFMIPQDTEEKLLEDVHSVFSCKVTSTVRPSGLTASKNGPHGWMRDRRGDVDEVGYLTRLENEHKASRRQRQAVAEAPVQIVVARGDVMLPLCQINSGSVKPPLCVALAGSDKRTMPELIRVCSGGNRNEGLRVSTQTH